MGIRPLLLAALVAAAPLLATETATETLAETAIDQHGNVHRWKAEPGAVTVVDFAASWCGPCRATLPRLEALAERHPELRVLVISVDDQVAGRDALVRDLDLSLPVLWDEGHAAAEHYRPEGMPSSFLFDVSGEEVLRLTGSSAEDWQRLVREVDARLR